MKIAVIGSGISGLGAAYFLSKKYTVDLFEKENYFGGHSYTLDIVEENKNQIISVDLGFIVFNKINYPNLLNFFNNLNVNYEKSDMAFAVCLIWINPKKTEKIIYIYFIHLLVNASWSVIFFALHQVFLALVVIVLILLLVLWLMKLYYPINKLSSFLMVPYLVWLVFAFILNLNILLLN